MNHKYITLFAYILLSSFLSPLVWSQTVSSTVDRDVISEEDTFRLVLDVTGDNRDQQPNLEPLKKDFDILGTSQTSRIQILNGKTNASKQWFIVLAPKRTGKLIIPSLRLGKAKTDPITIQVLNAKQATSSTQQRDVFIESDVDTHSPYVQGQVILTIKIFHTVPILEGSLSKPEMDAAIVERLGDDVTYETKRNGKKYKVIERRLALFPQRSGTLTLPAIHFNGKVADSRSQSRSRANTFFGSGFFNDPFDMLQPTKTIRTRSKAISLSVKTKPNNAQGSQWLPAKRLSFTETWSPQPAVFQVGVPVTRTITLKADGLTAAQLPKIPLTHDDSINVYPDKRTTENNRSQSGIIGSIQQKIALIPTLEGQFTLPEMQIPWWNTQTNQQEIASIPAVTIDVKPGTSGKNTGGAPAQSLVLEQNTLDSSLTNEETTMEPLTTTHAISSTTSTSPFWPWLTGALALAWLTTLMLWVRERRRRVNKRNEKPVATRPDLGKQGLKTAQRQRQLQHACISNDPLAVRDTLLDWAKTRWPKHSIQTLGDIVQHIDDSQAAEALRNLDSLIYADKKQLWDGKEFLSMIKPILTYTIRRPKQKQASLPELYPS